MSSEYNVSSGEKIKKATELLQKIWWFSWFLIIAPLTVSIACFFILNLFQLGFIISLSLSVVAFMFALLFFYKAFDKYRNKPFFLNKKNNLVARIHILYLISISAFIVSPIFIVISRFSVSLVLLPLISYVVLYNIIYYYYYYQPIDYFNLTEKEFKHAGNLELSLKQPYNFLILVNYIIHIIFLGFTANTNFSWLYALITNLLLYLITLVTTKNQIKKIHESIVQEKPILNELTVFKKKFVLSILSLIFITLVLIPSINIITLLLSGTYILSLVVINSAFLIVIFILFYFKARFYVGYYFSLKLQLYEGSEIDQNTQKRTPLLSTKYQRLNSYFSGIIILLITLFCFLINQSYINLVILPILYIFFYYEQKAELCPKIFNRYVLLLNSIAILITISFGLIPVTPTTFLLNFLIVSITSYFLLQIFVKYEYFLKENIIVYQNLLAITSISLIVYSFFPLVIFGYTNFTSDPFLIIISNILLHGLLISMIFLISQYALGLRYFKVKYPKSFRTWVLLNWIVLEFTIFSFILFRLYFVIDIISFFMSILISSTIFPIFCIFFLFINNCFHIFPLESFLKNSYKFLWIIMFNLFITLFIVYIFNTYMIILALDFLILSIFYYFLLQFGYKLERIPELNLRKRIKINSYLITIELLSIFYFLFYTVFHALTLFDNVLYSIYLSLVIVCGVINLFSKKGIFSEDLYIKINIFVLFYSLIIAFYFFLNLTINTFYVICIPLMVSSLIYFLPILYLKNKRIYNKFTSKSIVINSIIFSATILLIPTVIGLEIFFLGIYFDLLFLIMTVINFTLYIGYAIFTITYIISKRYESSEKRLKFYLKLLVFIEICVSGTTVFYYFFFILFNSLYLILLPLIFTSCFLYLPLVYSYKKVVFKIDFLKQLIWINTIILTGLVTALPIIIGINLVNLGFIFDPYFFILNILNSCIYIFYLFVQILIYLSQKLTIKEALLKGLKRLQFILLFIISFTTVFFYPFLLLFGTFYSVFLPLIALLSSWFLLFYYSYKREYFNLDLVKKLTIYNFFALSILIISLPTIIGLELIRIGFLANLILILMITTLLIFSFLKISETISVKIKLKEKYIRAFKLSSLITWFMFSLFLPYYIASSLIISLEINATTLLIISSSCFVFFILNTYTLRMTFIYSKRLSNMSYLQDIIIYAIILSITFICIFTILSVNLFWFLVPLPLLLRISVFLGFFIVIFLMFLVVFDNLIELQLIQLKIIIKLMAWLSIKIIICILLFSIIDYFAYQFSIINKITLVSLIFTFLTPITLEILKNLKYISSKNQNLMKRIVVIMFITSLLSLYIEILLLLTTQISIFILNPWFLISTVIINMILILYYSILRFNKIAEEISNYRIFSFYIFSIILCGCLLLYGSILSIFLVIISYLIILSKRSIFPIFRFSLYLLLSYSTFVETCVIISFYNTIYTFSIGLIGFYAILYLLSLGIVLIFSILLNFKKNNNLEEFSLYSVISVLSFVSLILYTSINPIYNITISLLEFLLLTGISLYRKNDERYKWFIKPCVILFAFDLISFLSNYLFFINPIFDLYRTILTFTLTLSLTGFSFILLYNDSPPRFRRKSFYVVLISIVLSFPTFIYFLIIAGLSMPILSLIPLTVAINLGVFLFYLSIGIYQWKISWAIWKSGWYVWNILPIVNWFIIYQSLTGIDLFRTGLWSIGTFKFGGAFFLTLIICSLFFLPVVYTVFKKYFSLIVFVVWGESLFLLYWFSQNLFVADLILRNLFFILFSAALLMPLFAIFKFWKIISIFWIFPLTFVNTLFLLFYLISIGLSLQITISIDILIVGLFFVIYSFFPNIRSIGTVLIIAYCITLLGIFLTIFFILYTIIQNIIFSINISLIIFGFTLFSSKFLKLPKRVIDLCLSWILIINFTWLTFNTFSLFPGLLLLAFSLALTIGGCSFFIFNRYKMKFRINKVIPFLIVAIGTSLTITSLVSIIFMASLGILISIFSSVFIIFLYFIFIEYRYLLWFGIPIPIITPIIEYLLTFELIQPFWFLVWALLYLISFQAIFNIFKVFVKEDTSEIKNSIYKIYRDKNQVKWLNFTCFLLNSVCISLFSAIIIPGLLQQIIFTQFLIIYQVCDFLMIWPILFLLCMKYVIKSKLDLKLKDILYVFSKLSSVLYILIPLSLGVNLLLFLIYVGIDLLVLSLIVILAVSGVLFIEVLLLDKNFFKLLFNLTRYKFILLSWFVFCNTLSIYLYIIHYNVFLLVLTISLLNLVTVQFLSHLNVPPGKISNYRLILIYNALIWSSFYVASLISDGLIILFPELGGSTYYTLLFQNSSLFLYILSVLFIKIDKKLKNRIEVVLFIIFQVLVAINLLLIFTIYSSLNFLLINIIILIEICLSFNSIKYLNKLILSKKLLEFVVKIHSFLILILYFEISIILYGLLNLFLGLYESIIISLSVLFVLTLFDLYSLKAVKESYIRSVHTATFFTLSLLLFLILFNLVSTYPFLFSLGLFIFLFMQFYTNYSLFSTLKLIFPDKKDPLNKAQIYIRHIIGIGFYITLCFAILQPLILQGFELPLILLVMSAIIHFLMIIDQSLLKFLGKLNNYVKVISWILIMIFSSSYLILLYSTYFISFILSVIPIIIILFIIELAYLFKQLEFWQVVASNKEKIKFYLIVFSYLNFISWPLYFSSLNFLIFINLLLASFFILFVISLIDTVLKENFRNSLKSYSFLIIGILFSIDVYLLFDLIPNFNIFLNLSISSLVFIFFLGFKIKPFKERQHTTLALIFWVITFSLLSSIIYHISFSIEGSLVFLGLTILIYPFVFLLEELKRLLNKFVDIVTHLFRSLKIFIKNLIIKFFNFIKLHYKILWIIFSIFISILIGILISPLVFNLLNPILSTIFIFAIFGILYSIMPSKQSDDVNVMFRRRMTRLIISWGSLIIVIFGFITPVWYIFTIWISVWILGAILLPYIRFKEKNENISIKWRFYTLIILIIFLILLGIIVGVQIFINFIL